MKDKPHGNTGNRHAEKPDDELHDSQLFIRCMKVEKSAWVRAAYPDKLSAWVRRTLNRAANFNPDNEG